MRLPRDIIDKMSRYNRLMSQVEDLKDEVEAYLATHYNIRNWINTPFSENGACPIYEWGTARFDIKQIEDIIAFIDKYQREVGEFPDEEEIREHFEG